MKKSNFYLFLVVLSLWANKANSQVNCVTDPPLPPVLTSVSVQPETGFTVLKWTLSPSPDIAAYIVYSYQNGDGLPLDTLWDANATSYTVTTEFSKYFSVSYVVAAMQLPRCTSILSNVLTTIYLSAAIDTCKRRIVILWNSYPSIPKVVQDYSIFYSTDGGTYNELAKVNADSSTYVYENFETNQEYYFYIRANLDDGSFSTSNADTLITLMQKPPGWINADYATVNEQNGISLSFSIDPETDIRTFSLERKTGPSGIFREISRFNSVSGNLDYSDENADTGNINYYRLSALNNCKIPLTVSNICSNIVLSLARDGDRLTLSWNPYKEWLGSVSSYKLFINTGRGFEERSDILPNDTLTTLGYNEIMYEVSGGKVCFYVSAIESDNPHGINGESRSSVVCTEATEVVTVPNVFTPDNDLVNDLFKPVMSFTPLDYHLVISDRNSNVLFDSKDYMEEWDGSRKGDPQPQGVYLWFLKVTTPSGKVISKTGTITIIRNR
jgi:gliding motility-associated-like protein